MLLSGSRDRARALLVEAARHGGGRESYMELGLLLEAAGDGDKALQYYRRGLERLDRPAEPIPVASRGELLPPVSEQTDSSSEKHLGQLGIVSVRYFHAYGDAPINNLPLTCLDA